MNNMICNECGTSLPQNATECPNCGCPAPMVPQSHSKKDLFSSVNIPSIIALLLGVIIIVLGVSLLKKDISIDSYRAKTYDAEYTAFGGDFYTSIYGATDIIVDELSDINGGIQSLSENLVVIVETIYYVSGVIVISLGLGVVSTSCIHLLKKD